MANGGQTKQDLLDQIDELQQENQDLRINWTRSATLFQERIKARRRF